VSDDAVIDGFGWWEWECRDVGDAMHIL